MRHRRRRIVTALLTMLLIASSWLAMLSARPGGTFRSPPTPSWQPKHWYQLDSDRQVAVCELPAGHRYRLVLGCLGDSAQEHRVSIRLMTTSSGPRGDDRREFEIERLFARTSPVDRSAESPASATDEPSSSGNNPTQTLVAPRDVFLHVTDGSLDDPKQYVRITTDNVACGRRVRIFADRQLTRGEVPQSRIEELVQMLDDVVPRIESQFGSLSDIDGDGSLAIVLTPWLSRLQGGRTSIGGMVRSSDYQRNVSPPFGNRSDTLFLNSSLPNDSALRDLVSHEVAHAACLSQRLSRETGTLRDEEDWLSEALAHLAEPGWSNLDHRLRAFLDDPSQFPLVVPDYYRAGLWRNHGCRGATYLFTRWCVGTSDSRRVHQLAQSTERGTRNLEKVTGRRFENLFREWTLFLSGGDPFDSSEMQSILHRFDSTGIRPIVVPATNREHTAQVRGTAFSVVDLLVDGSSPQTLHITGDSTTKWQFSIRQEPDFSGARTPGKTLAAIQR